jgi:probable biosynthetic protein (TIGR04098 family)
MDRYDLVLGMAQTNYLGFAEHLLLMHVGACHWNSLGKAVGMPMSALRTPGGQEIYATFYFIEERFPDQARLNTFRLDDRLTFAVFLRGFKGIAVESQIVFDRTDRLEDWLAAVPARIAAPDALAYPYVRMATIFITPEGGNSRLKVASPAGVDFSGLALLPNDDNPYQLTREAKETLDLGLLVGWTEDTSHPAPDVIHAIDIDRDTNGAGIVYFANYVAFMDRAERETVNAGPPEVSSRPAPAVRVVQQRRIAYFGNASTSDRIHTRVRVFRRSTEPSKIAFRYEMRREEDDELICLSEAIKALCDPPARA